MGYQHLVDKFFADNVPAELGEVERSEILEMTRWLLTPCVNYVHTQLSVVSPSMEQNLVQSFMVLFLSLIKDALEFSENFQKNADDVAASEVATKNIIMMIDCYAIFALTFSCGAACVTESKPLFSKFLQKLLNNQADGVKAFKKVNPPLPDRGLTFDYIWDRDTLSWRPWMETVEEQVLCGN